MDEVEQQIERNKDRWVIGAKTIVFFLLPLGVFLILFKKEIVLFIYDNFQLLISYKTLGFVYGIIVVLSIKIRLSNYDKKHGIKKI